MTSQSYFVDGGTLQPNDPSYVTRPADHELLQKVQEGAFCYVLTARQMGKSSLMIRAAQKLSEQGTRVALVDLTVIGVEATADQWYLGLLTSIIRELKLAVDVEGFWKKNSFLPAKQRFIDFLHDIILKEVKENIAIFIDEIDSALSIDFGDDFFAGIRAMYSARARDAEYKRLTFVLLGVATPNDLMKDPRIAQYNIGSQIVLQEFSSDDAMPLRMGLERYFPGQGDRMLARIFYWTNGHPYLTQHLCQMATQVETSEWSEQQIDELVESRFFSEGARRNTNLTFVRDRIRFMKPDIIQQEMLQLYSLIYSRETIEDDDRSQPQLYLKLYGLVRAEKGKLQVSNEIYRRVFNQEWIAENLRTIQNNQIMPKRKNYLYIGVGIGILILIAVVLIIVFKLR